MIVNLVNSQGVLKQCKVGFSWTVLFFSFFVPLYRGDSKWALIMLLMYMVSILTFFFIDFISPLVMWIVMAFVYNRIYIHGLLAKNFVATDEFSEQCLKRKGYIY